MCTFEKESLLLKFVRTLKTCPIKYANGNTLETFPNGERLRDQSLHRGPAEADSRFVAVW